MHLVLFLHFLKGGFPGPVRIMVDAGGGCISWSAWRKKPHVHIDFPQLAHQGVAGMTNHARSAVNIACKRGDAPFIRVSVASTTAVSGQAFKARVKPAQSTEGTIMSIILGLAQRFDGVEQNFHQHAIVRRVEDASHVLSR